MKNIFKKLLLSLLVFVTSFTIVQAAINIVPNGGSGVGTITGIIQGNGTSPFSAITVGSGLTFSGGTLSATGSGGTVTSITALSPLTGGTITTTGNIGCQIASVSQSGCISSTDWSTFNGKLTNSLTSSHIFVGNGSNIATDTALSGDATISNTGVLTLGTVNANVGTFGSSTSIPTFTVNAKGLITAASGNVVIAPAGTLTGTTLASNVVNSSLTTLGTITIGTWNGTIISPTYGGTGVNNGAKTITLGGNLTTSGAFNTTLTVTGPTNVTLPTSGTLLNNTLTSAHLLIGSAGNVATDTAVTGDVTINNTGVTAIGANKVLNTMIRQGVARSVIGVAGNATANVADIQGTANQVLVINNAGTALTFGQVNLASASAVTGILGTANGGSGGTTAVNSVTNSDSTLIFSPTNGAVVGSLNLNNPNTWTATQTGAIWNATQSYNFNGNFFASQDTGNNSAYFGFNNFNNPTNTNSTFVGNRYLSNLVNPNLADITAVGFNTGASIINGVNRATLIGSGADSIDGINDVIAIGVGSQATSSNQLVIGSVSSPILDYYFGRGVRENSGSPAIINIHATEQVTGTNLQGNDLMLTPGLSTGSGTGGRLIFNYAPTGGTGTSVNASVQAGLVDSSGQLIWGAGGQFSVTSVGLLSTTGGVNLSVSNLSLTDVNVVLSTITGSKFGTATNQKLSFFNSTPVVQQTGNIVTGLSNLGLVVSGTLPAASLTGLVGAGISKVVASSDLTAQSAAIAATTLYAVAATGVYRISWNATITTAASTSSVLGGAAGFQIKMTSPTDSVVKTENPTNITSSAGNTTATYISGTEEAYAKTGTNLQYLFGYTSLGVTAMVYELHATVEYVR